MTASLLMFGMGEAMNGINFNMLTPLYFIPVNTRINSSIETDDMSSRVISFEHTFEGATYLAIYAVVAVVIILISYVLYKKKKLETVQDFIAVPFMKPVFSVGMSFFISMVAGAFVAGMIEAVRPLSYNVKYTIAIASAIVIGVIIYFATKMLIEKTLRVFTAKKLIYACIYSIAAVTVLLCMRFDVVNIEDKVPDASDIKWAGINNRYTMVFTDADEIETVRELHQNFLADKKELRDVNIIYPETSGTTYTIRYKLNNGNIIIRNYSVVDTKAKAVSAEYVAATQPILDFINDPGRIKEHIIGNIWNTGEISDMSFTAMKYNSQREDFDWNNNTFDELSSKEKKEKFGNVYKALLKDIDAGKVFVQSFSGGDYSYEDSQQYTLYNDFSFTIEDKNTPYFSDEETFWDYGDYFQKYPRYEQTIWVALTKDCIDTLNALKEAGFYESDDEVITYGEFNKIMGLEDEPYDGLDGGVDDYY